MLSVVPERCRTRGGDSRLSEEKHLLHLWASAQVPHRFSQGGGAEAGSVVRLWHSLSRQDMIVPTFSKKMSPLILNSASTKGFFSSLGSTIATSLLTLGFMPFLYYYRLKTFFIHPWGEIHHLLQSMIQPRLKVLLELGSWDKVHANECADVVAVCFLRFCIFKLCLSQRQTSAVKFRRGKLSINDEVL